MPSLSPTLPTTAAVIAFAMLALWIVATARRDASIVDPFWGIGFVIVAVVAWRLNAPASNRVLLLVALTTFWGVRLSAFLVWRNRSHGEDRRYASMRKRHGASFWWVSLFTVFLLQGVILWIVSLPIQFAAIWNQPSPLGWLDAIGLAVWGVGYFFEAVGDWQLARFKRDPRNTGRVLDRGLWRYTRHPNYFGDFCIWWGIYLIATAGGAWATAFSPLLMSWLLLKVSGVTLLEQTITDRRPEYAAYQRRTNAFFPGPTKNKVKAAHPR